MKIIRESEVMKKILADFVDFARPRKPVPEACDVEILIGEIHSIFHAEFGGKNISFTTDIRPKHLFADPGHVRQMLMNIVENALQSIEQNGAIHISTLQRERDIEVTIEDTGHGIDDDIRDKIFDPFFTTKERGSGLGLAIVKKLADENNGDVRLEPDRERGSTFVISFPKSEMIRHA